MSRRDEVLAAAAAELDKLSDPFHHAFLVEHTVTLDECGDLADDLALGARMVMAARGELAQGGLVATVAAHRIGDALAHASAARRRG